MQLAPHFVRGACQIGDFVAAVECDIDRQITLSYPVDAFSHDIDTSHQMACNQHRQQQTKSDGKPAHDDR